MGAPIKYTLVLDELHVGFIRALAAQGQTTDSAVVTKMIEANLAAACRGLGEIVAGGTAGVPQSSGRGPGHPTPPEVRDEMLALRRQGLNYSEIARRLNLSRTIPWRFLRSQGL